MNRNKIDRIREYINIRLYRHKSYVISVFQVLSVFVSLMAIGTIIYFHGFPVSEHTMAICNQIINASFIFFLFKFIVKVFYEFHPVDFIKANAFEAFIMFTVFLDLLGLWIAGDHLIKYFFNAMGFVHLTSYYLILVQLYLFLIIIIELGKASQNLAIFKLGPSGLLSLSFIILILSGAGLLFLPEMSTHGISFIDALFTSTSACCVTGLTSVDTALCFTLKGKIIIMMLIQFGGINIISFATFFATFYRNSGGLRTQSILKDLMSNNRLSDNKGMLQQIILFSLSIEMIGAVLMYFTWSPYMSFHGFGEKAFFSLFHSVSAFNNAGFALFSDNMWESTVRYSYNLQLVISALIFLGGIGFFVLQDMFSPARIRERIKYKWKGLAIGSKVAIQTSLVLIIFGALAFYFIERDNTLKGYSWYGIIVTSIFQSVTTRTAGFNSVDMVRLGQPVILIFMFLMFVGASPGSTGGGIKTTTFALLLRSVYTTIKGKKNVELFRHTVPFDLIDKSYSIIIFSMLLIFIGTLALSITEPGVSMMYLLFEEISAFGTVGLSLNLTPTLSEASKLILIVTMYVGRIGTLTLALALTRRVKATHYKYPETSIMVG